MVFNDTNVFMIIEGLEKYSVFRKNVIQTKLNLGYLKGNMQGLSESTVFEVVIQEKPSEEGDLWFKK